MHRGRIRTPGFGKTQQLGKCLPSLAVFLGANNLTVGTNNLGTTFSGLIQDGGSGGGTGGSLTKAGSGKLTLTKSNTYTGDTTIKKGTCSSVPLRLRRAGPASGWKANGAMISILPTASSGYHFSNWTGTDTGSYSGTNNPAPDRRERTH